MPFGTEAKAFGAKGSVSVTLGSRSVVLQRRLKIADWIRRNGVTRVDALCGALGVSAVTIRSDLAYLEVQGLIVRSSGKAHPTAASMPSAAASAGLTRAEARPMLGLAASLLGDETSILLGPGSLTSQLAGHLPARLELGVVVTSLDALSMARQCLDGPVYLLGGQLCADGVSFDGPQAVHALAFHRIETFFVQGEAIAAGAVLLAPGSSEAFCQAASRRSVRTIILVNGNGRSTVSHLPRLSLADADHVILPSGADRDAGCLLLDAGFSLVDDPDTEACLYTNETNKNQEMSK